MSGERTIPELITSRIKKYGGKICLQRKDGWSWKQLTWLDFEGEVKNIASFLMGLGFGPGDSALLVSCNRLESLLSEVAIWFIGGVTSPISEDESLENISKAAKDSRAKLIFVGEESTLRGILCVSEEIQTLNKIVTFSDFVIGENEMVIPYKALVKFGSIKRKQLGDELIKISKSLLPGSPAMISWNFDTAEIVGKKEITHRHLVEVLHSASERLSFIDGEDQSFSCLPSATPFEKLVNHLGMHMGIRVVMAESRPRFFEDIIEVKPTVLFETRKGLEDNSSGIVTNLGKNPPAEKIRGDLGGRIKYVFTDSPPRGEIKNLFLKSGISIVEIPELNGILA